MLNGHVNVRAETREKVLAAVESSGYRVNELARNLRTAESRLLLTMVPDVGNPFYAEIVRGIAASRASTAISCCCATRARIRGRERSYFDLLRRRRADGAICLDPAAVQQALAEESNTLPWVACCEFDPSVGVPYVGIDNYRAAGDAVAPFAVARPSAHRADQLERRTICTRASVSKVIWTRCATRASRRMNAGART